MRGSFYRMKKIVIDDSFLTKVKGLKVDLYINSSCNFSCPYCATKSEFGKFKMMDMQSIKYFIDCVSAAKYDVVLCLLGGEPTLHKHLNEIIDYASTKPVIKEIELYTNGSIDLSKIKIEKCRVVISIHPHKYNRYKEKILKNIQLLNPENSMVKIMNEDIDFSEIVSDMNNIKRKFLISYITNPDNSFKLGSDKLNQTVIKYGDTLISYKEYIKNFFKLSPRSVYRCLMDSVSILSNGDIIQYCGPNTIVQNLGNLFNDPAIIKKFKIRLLKCDRCHSDGCQELEIKKFIC